MSSKSLEFDGEFQMYTGTDDIYKVGQISKWKNESDLSYYYPGACAELTGSAGEFFPQDRDKTIFEPQKFQTWLTISLGSNLQDTLRASHLLGQLDVDVLKFVSSVHPE